MYFLMSTESPGQFSRRIKSVFYMVQRLSFGTFQMDHPVGWDAVDIWNNFPLCLVVGVGIGDTKVNFGMERMPGPHPII